MQGSEYCSHVVPVILCPDVLEHPNARDAIKLLCEISIVLEKDFYWKTSAGFGCMTALFLGYGDPHNAATVMFGRVFGEASPSAANIQKTHALLQSKLAADQIHFFALRLGEVVGSSKPRARVLHRRIEHRIRKNHC